MVAGSAGGVGALHASDGVGPAPPAGEVEHFDTSEPLGECRFDNSSIALGLHRYGFTEEAGLIAEGIIDAAQYFDSRLPEAFAGYEREMTEFPCSTPPPAAPRLGPPAHPCCCCERCWGWNRAEITGAGRKQLWTGALWLVAATEAACCAQVGRHVGS
jgi:hypothetical protein